MVTGKYSWLMLVYILIAICIILVFGCVLFTETIPIFFKILGGLVFLLNCAGMYIFYKELRLWIAEHK